MFNWKRTSNIKKIMIKITMRRKMKKTLPTTCIPTMVFVATNDKK